MKNVLLEIIENKPLNPDVYLLKLQGDITSIKNPGEFIEISIPNFFLRRPFSVCFIENNYLYILYKLLGEGTKALTKYRSGYLDCLIGLGNGFNTKAIKPLLIGGGIGIAPLLELAKRFSEKNVKCQIVLGYKTKEEVLLVNEFEMYGDVYISLDSENGNIINYLDKLNLDYDYYYACGPSKMLEILSTKYQNGYISLEERMGCGFGACMGCSIKTTNGYKRVCKEGPVFSSDEVKWNA